MWKFSKELAKLLQLVQLLRSAATVVFQLKGPLSSQEGALNPRASVEVLDRVELSAEVAAGLAP